MPTTNTNSAALILPDPVDATNAAAPAEIADIRGIKGAVDIPTGNEWVLWLLGALAIFVVVLVVAWFVRRHLAKRNVELAPPPPPPPGPNGLGRPPPIGGLGGALPVPPPEPPEPPPRDGSSPTTGNPRTSNLTTRLIGEVTSVCPSFMAATAPMTSATTQ